VSKIEFYFDENMEPFETPIREANSLHITYDILGTVSTIGRSAKDQDIVNYLRKRKNLTVILTQDSDFVKRDLRKEIFTSNNTGVFVFSFKKGSKTWDKFISITKIWDKLIKFSESNPPPFSYSVNSNGRITKI